MKQQKQLHWYVLKGNDAPLASELEAFLEKNSDCAPLPRDDIDTKDSDEEGTSLNK